MLTHTSRSREAYIGGLYALADYLDTHPDVPVPLYGTEILVAASRVEEGGTSEVLTASLALHATLTETEDGCETRRIFGPVGYKVYAVTRARMARYHAGSSYAGCVQPDTEAATDA